jgi:glyceraldehyde 3-phosphate dehydrogenase
LKYDSVHGRFNGTVEVANFVNKETFVLLQRNPADLKWNEDVDVLQNVLFFHNS